jgi:hypothetical protein
MQKQTIMKYEQEVEGNQLQPSGKEAMVSLQ